MKYMYILHIYALPPTCSIIQDHNVFNEIQITARTDLKDVSSFI